MPLASLIDGSIKAARMGQIYVSKLHWSISRGKTCNVGSSLLNYSLIFIPGVLYSYFERFGRVESVYIPYVSWTSCCHVLLFGHVCFGVGSSHWTVERVWVCVHAEQG